MHHAHRTRSAAASALLCCALGAACPSTTEGFTPPPPGPLRAGAAQVVLRLPVGHPHAGYFQSVALGSEPPPDDPGSPFADTFPATRGVQSAPSARAIVLDNGHTDVVLVRLDMVYLTEEITAHTLARVKERLGRDLRGRLLINATHTHGAGQRASAASILPAALSDFPPDDVHGWALGGDSYSAESLHRVVEPIVDAIDEAYRQLRPARVGYGFGENTTAAGDRRCESDWLEGEDQSDKRVTAVRIDELDTGAPIAMVVGYAMHGIAYDRDSRHLTVDAPGHVEYAIEAAMPSPVMAFFLQGNVGDMSPRGWARGHGGSQAMARAGWDLAQTALAIYDGIETEHEVALSGIDRAIELGHERLGYDIDEFHFGGGLLCSTGREGCEVSAPATPAEVFCVGAADIEGAKTRTWISALRIGGLHLIGVPGEPVGSYGKGVAAAIEGVLPPSSDVVIAGLAMDHNGYLLEPDDWLSGGYEPTISPWGWRMGPYLKDQLVDLARELTTGERRAAGAALAPITFSIGDWSPVEATASVAAPAEVSAPAATVRRLETAAWAFAGGDPAVDQPEITVERFDGAWIPVLDGAWKALSSATGPHLPLFYVATPSYRDAPDARVRDHRWQVQWEPARDAPLGLHRFVVRGRSAAQGVEEYLLTSTPFDVVANDRLLVEARLVIEPERAVFLTVRYPAMAPVYSALSGSTDWQVDGFSMVDPWFAPPFVPLLTPLPERPVVELVADGVAIEQAMELRALSGTAAPVAYAPGEGPGFVVDAPISEVLELRVPVGALRDEWGNSNARAEVLLSSE